MLLQREPFGDILEKTLEAYFLEQYGQIYNVRWNLGRPSAHSDATVWYSNAYLNIVFRPDCEREPLQPAVREFERSIKWWRTPLNKLYVALAMGRVSARWLAGASLVIDPPLEHANQMVIIGGNHHIRLLDYHSRACTVICKHGFNRKFMLDEIALRGEYQNLLSPRVLDASPSGTWYREELILVKPINRLKDVRIAQEAVARAWESMSCVRDGTTQSEPVKPYAERLHAHIGELLARNHLLSAGEKSLLSILVDRLVKRVDDAVPGFETVQAHGDFQPANILAGEGGPWLIDWEYTMRRQLDYDALVFLLTSRHPSGLSVRMRDALLDTFTNPMASPELQVFAGRNNEERMQLLALFLLEETELRLIENDNAAFRFMDAGFPAFMRELQTAVDVLK